MDTETTGLGIFGKERRDDHALSIGMLVADIDLEARQITCLDCMDSLIRIPDPSKAEDTFFVHGITPEQVAAAPAPEEVCQKFLTVHGNHSFAFAGAWNHKFDKYFVDKLFKQGGVRQPGLNWIEMQPKPYAKLDNYADSIRCEDIRALPGHNALNDCFRALGVYATIGGMEMDVSKVSSRWL
ncbi:3'-5' exonuclease [Methanocella sp. MCL-LM]|uniref:3'-5' exonuclease n=1 Tax=Methanocella sp. MCL-LM TaxID=3412035 RepID=UPI003C738324